MTLTYSELFLLVCALVALAAYLNERQKLQDNRIKTHRLLTAIAEKEVEIVDQDDSYAIKLIRR